MKEDARKYNGGNKNAGRKPKAEEELLIEKLSPHDDDVIAVLINKAVNEQDMKAVQLFMSYRFGQPKQKHEVKDTTEEQDINSMTREELRKYLASIRKRD